MSDSEDKLMTIDEARALLSSYVEGRLDPTLKQQVEAAMVRAPQLREELQELQEENELFSEALAPLRPSQSTRLRVCEEMVDTHKQAEEAERVLRKRKLRIMRVVILLILAGLCLILVAALIYINIKKGQQSTPSTPLPPPSTPPGIASST